MTQSIVDLDPHDLVPNDRNPRSDVGDVTDLTASIRAVGILQPLVVLRDGSGDRHRIVIGHRRHRAALELNLPTVPCLVVDTDDAAAEIVTMLAENLHRVGLTVTEEADAYAQLALLDYTVDQIAAVAARPVARIRNALALTSLPAPARQAADTGTLTLDCAVELQEFADDAKAMARILKRGTGWGFEHAIADERRKRERATAVERLKAELVLAGVRIITKPKNWGYGATKEAEASTLLDRDGNPLDPDTLRTKPGFAAIVVADVYGGPRAEIVCVDPEAWGYTRTRANGYVSDADQAARAAAEAAAQARREALDVATGVRHKFLRHTFGSTRAAKTVFLHAVRVTVADPRLLHHGSDLDDLATALAGTAIPTAVTTAGADGLTRMLVARWACGQEHNLNQLAAGRRWNTDAHAAVEWLDRLVEAGYTLSDAETDLRAELAVSTEDDEPDDEEPGAEVPAGDDAEAGDSDG
jgi:ParB family chromosome partitioning protein